MLFYLTFRLISATAAFLYPGYASYKTLSQRPASEAELERWLMYWSVLGCIVAVEYVAEWLINWLPFYYPLKTIFLLYLALPQTAGSAYLYQTHLRPFFAAHEQEIDSALAQFKAYLYSSLQRYLRRAWEHVSGTVAQMQSQPAGMSPLEEEAAANTGAPPTLGDPVSGPAQLVAGLWGTYGPGLLASGAALLRQAQTSAAQAATNANAQAGSGSGSSRRKGSAAERRRQLEAELASLPSEAQGYDVSSAASSPAFESVPMPPADNPSRNSSSGSLRDRSGSGNGGSKSAFEEVEVPSDMEGEGPARPGSDAARRSSWFGWGGGGAGYERVKND